METVGLAERLLALLDQAAVATTYKYALLLALIDAALAGTDADGEPPERIPVRTLAEHARELYWPQPSTSISGASGTDSSART